MPEGPRGPPPPGPLLLDTHVWLWVVNGQSDELAADALSAIDEASRRGEILVSGISVWEVAMLEARGRIRVGTPVEEWVRAALRAPGTNLLELDPGIAIESTRLPGDPHGDPADRILMAGARLAGARLVTRDRHILEYGEEGHVGTVDARP